MKKGNRMSMFGECQVRFKIDCKAKLIKKYNVTLALIHYSQVIEKVYHYEK